MGEAAPCDANSSPEAIELFDEDANPSNDWDDYFVPQEYELRRTGRSSFTWRVDCCVQTKDTFFAIYPLSLLASKRASMSEGTAEHFFAAVARNGFTYLVPSTCSSIDPKLPSYIYCFDSNMASKNVSAIKGFCPGFVSKDDFLEASAAEAIKCDGAPNAQGSFHDELKGSAEVCEVTLGDEVRTHSDSRNAALSLLYLTTLGDLICISDVQDEILSVGHPTIPLKTKILA